MGPGVLLLTDRLNEGLQLQRSLGQAQACVVIALHQAQTYSSTCAIIVCHVAIDNAASVELLRAALQHHRAGSAVPVLCLTRDPSQLTRAQAHAVGATATLPDHTPGPAVAAFIQQMIGCARPKNPGVQGNGCGIRASIAEAGTALADLIGAAQRHQPISAKSLGRGGDIVLAAIGQAKIRAWLDVVWNYDDITYQHCLLVAGLAAAFALDLGLPLKTQRLLSQAALVHDIGKANIPLEILNKQSQLTMSEMAVMRTHAAAGYAMLAGQPGLDPRLLDIVHHHHEYLDGSGYPHGLHAPHISPLVRIVTICDIYSALIERRSYKAPTPPEQALVSLAGMGRKLDGGLVRAFHHVVQNA